MRAITILSLFVSFFMVVNPVLAGDVYNTSHGEFSLETVRDGYGSFVMQYIHTPEGDTLLSRDYRDGARKYHSFTHSIYEKEGKVFMITCFAAYVYNAENGDFDLDFVFPGYVTSVNDSGDVRLIKSPGGEIHFVGNWMYDCGRWQLKTDYPVVSECLRNSSDIFEVGGLYLPNHDPNEPFIVRINVDDERRIGVIDTHNMVSAETYLSFKLLPPVEDYYRLSPLMKEYIRCQVPLISGTPYGEPTWELILAR